MGNDETEMRKFFTKLFCGKDAASLFSENLSLKAQVKSLKNELEMIKGNVQNPTSKMILNPPNSRKPDEKSN